MGRMWTSVVFLAIVGLTVAGNLQSPSQWQENQEYTYEVYSKTLTALPDLRDQYVGVVTKGKLIVQAKSENQIFGKLVKAANAHFHDDLTNGFVSDIPEQKLSYTDSPLNNKVFVVNYNNGVVRSVVVDNSMSNDDVNQLKAILSQLQIDVKGSRVIPCRHNQLPEDDNKPYGLYKTMEPSVTGECETLYEINPLPAYVETYQNQNEQVRSVSLPGELIEIVKTINYNNCDSRRGYHYGVTGENHLNPNTNQIGDLLSKSTITKIVLSGSLNQGTIKSSTTVNRIAVNTALNQREKGQVYSEISLSLTKMEVIAAQISLPSHQIDSGNLVFRYSLPSDTQNKVRQADNVIESNGSSSSASGSSEESAYQQQTGGNEGGQNGNQLKKNIQKHHRSPVSSSSQEDSNEAYYKPKYSHHYQPRPNMNEAPEHPFHPFTIGQKSLRHLTLNELQTEARKIIYEIASDLQNPNEIPKENTLEKFDIITDLIRIMNQEQIISLGSEFNWLNSRSLKNNLARKTYRDAVAQAGTGPTVVVITKWITESRIVGTEAAGVAETMFRSLRTPTEPIVRYLFEQLVQNNVVRENRSVYESVLLSFTDLVRRAYSDKQSAYNGYPVQSYGSFQKELQKLVLGEVIPYLAERLDEHVGSSGSQRAIVYIRALGNVAHPKIIGVYEKHLESQQVTNAQRTMMTMSLDKLAENFPRYTHNILYKILSNREQDPKTRSVAVMLFMRADPPARLLQTMAQLTNYNDNEIVQAVIASAINSAAQLTATENADLSANAEAARPFLNPQILGQQSAQSKMSDHVFEQFNIVRSRQVSYIMGEQGRYPSGLFYHENKNYRGYTVNEVELQAFVSNIERVWAQFQGSNNRQNQNGEETSYQKMSQAYLVEKLGVTADEAQNIEGQLLFNILGRKNFYSFDANSIKALPSHLANLLGSLSNGKMLEFNKLYNRREIIISFPLATGHSFIYEYKTPTLLQAIGEVKVQATPSIKKPYSWENLQATEDISVSAQIQLVLSTQQMGKVGFLTTFDSQRYVAGQVHKFQVYIPVQAKFSYNIQNNVFTGKITPLDKNNDINIFQASSWPFTAHKNGYSLRPVAESKDIRLIETRPSKGFEVVYGEKTNGLAIAIQMEHQISPNTLVTLQSHYQRQVVNHLSKLPTDLVTALRQVLNRNHSWTLESLVALVQSNVFSDLFTIPWSAVGRDHYMFNVKYDASRSTNNALKLSVQVNNEQHIANSKPESMSTKVFAGIKERKLSFPADFSATQSQQRRNQFLQNAALGFQQASATVVDATIVFDGEKRAEYIATLARGQNSANNRQRVLIFLTAPLETTKTQQLCATYNSYLPNTSNLNYDTALNNNDQASSNLEVTLGNECSSSISYVQVSTQMKQTEAYKQHVRQNHNLKHEKQQMPAHLKATFQANFYDQVHFTAQSKGLTKSMENVLHKVLSLLRYNGYNHLVQDNNKKGHPHQIEGNAQISLNHQYVNVTVQMPESIDEYTGLVLPSFARVFFFVNPSHSWEQRINQVVDRYQKLCVVDKSEILTFDNRYVQGQSIGKCWYAVVLPAPVAKNLPTQQLYNNDQVTVLIRQIADSQARQLLVLVDQKSEQQHRILLTPSADSFLVEVNGQAQQIDQTESVIVGSTTYNSREPLVRLYSNGNHEVSLSINGDQMNINFDGERVQIFAKSIYQDKLVGLCGRYNNQRVDDITTPKNCVLRDSKYFASSWAVTDDTCHAEIVRNKAKADKAACSPITPYYGGNIVSAFEAGRLRMDGQKFNKRYWQHSDSSHSSSSSSSEVYSMKTKATNVNGCQLKHQIQYVERNGKTCFSMEMIPACAHGCKPTNKVEQTVQVHCRDSTDSVAKMYAQQIRRGANPNLSGKKISNEMTYRVPQNCVAA